MKEWSRFVVDEDIDIYDMEMMFNTDSPEIGGADTETTGLHNVLDKAFMIIFGWGTKVFIFKPTPTNMEVFFRCAGKLKELFFWNTKYDIHMMENCGYMYPHNNLSDGMFIFRLTEYSDDEFAPKKLKQVAKRYIDVNADMYEKRVKSELQRLKKTNPNANYSHVDWDIICEYAHHDVIYMMEYVEMAYPLIDRLKQRETYEREKRAIMPLYRMECVGFRIDVEYLKGAEAKVRTHLEHKRAELTELFGKQIGIGQHATIKKWFKENYDMTLASTDKTAMIKLKQTTDVPKIMEITSLIGELRRLEKWYSTYIVGILDKLVDGRLYTSVNQTGAITGRVSSDLQQMPKDALYDDNRFDKNNKAVFEGASEEECAKHELFHPRKIVLPDGGDYEILAFADMSQIELRVQAIYTILAGNPDTNLCRAYMPYKCYHNDTLEEFNNLKHDWSSGEWFNIETGDGWTPTDIHSSTTKKAFPDVDPSTAQFARLRYSGKNCNFGKIYGISVKGLMEQHNFTLELATALSNGFNDTFPNVIAYQQWVVRNLKRDGYVENMLGRRYYTEHGSEAYKYFNYLIQGTCADLFKECICEIDAYILKNKLKSKFVMNIHDEVIISIYKGEEYIMPDIKAIMEDVSKWDTLKLVPVVSELEFTKTNWSKKVKWSKLYA